MQEDKKNRISDYLLGELQGSDAEVLQKEIESSKELRDEYEAQKFLIDAVATDTQMICDKDLSE